MYTAMNKGISAYQKIGVETSVQSADPHKLILMLYEGAQEALVKARLHIHHNEIAEKGQMISKAIMIIDHGLKASLDTNAGGDLAIKLQALYEYMAHRLLIANIQNDVEMVDEVNRLLFELHDAWKKIGQSHKTNITAPATTI